MSNIYEQMLLNDKAALETKITNLVEEKLNNNNEVDLELDLIAKVIDYSYTITDTCSFEVDYPYINGEKTFRSVEDYQERLDYYTAEKAERFGVAWDGDTEFCGSFSWDGCPEVSVEVEGLTEDASEEAKTIWEQKSKAERRQEQLDWKRERLEQAQKELLKLQADLAAAEANA